MSSSDTPKHGHAYVGDSTTDGTADAIAPIMLAEPVAPDAPGLPSNGAVATVVFDSLDDPREQSFNPHDETTAQSFSTGAGAATVTDVEVFVHGFSSYLTDGGEVTVTLWSDDDISPDAPIATLGTIADAALPASYQTVDLPVSGAPTLDADTRYWIQLTASTDNMNWGGTESADGTGVASEYADLNGIITPDGGGGEEPNGGGGIVQGGDNTETYLLSVSTSPACFAAGTRIRTARGEVPVEHLHEGDEVVTARGRLAPVRWIGHRRLSPARHPRPWDANPIRIRAGALAPGQPSRDLFLSPDHALLLDGVLIRARDLLNGATVVQEAAEKVMYFHVELDRHDALFAEGAPAESFLDTGNRAAFENGGATVMAHPDFARAVRDRNACAKLVWQGSALAVVRARLAARAWLLGWALTDEPDLHVVAGGRSIRPATRDGALVFDLPADVAEIRLRSRSAVPAHLLPDNADTRVLGVAIARLRLDGVPVPLDGPALGDGWLPPEPGLRWTSGAATLRTDGARRLEIVTADLRLPCWLNPSEADAAVLAVCA